MEIHKKTLQSSLEKLPNYEPPVSVWMVIERNLAESHLQDSIAQLPEYYPAEHLWNDIEREISNRYVRPTIWWLSAAGIFIVGSLGVWITQQQKTNSVSVSFSKEMVVAKLQIDSFQHTDQQFENIKEYCKEQTFICESKNFIRLKKEYEVLNTAAEQLKAAIGQYNTEPGLVRQFYTIEQEKGEILSEMAKMI